MADSEEIKKQVEATRDLKNETQDNLRFTRDINNEIRDSLKLLKGEKDLRSSTLKALKEANSLAEEQIDLAKAGSKALMDSNKLREKQITFQKNIGKLRANADDLAKKRIIEQRNLRNDMSKMSEKDIKKAQEQIDLSLQTEKALRDQAQNQSENKKLLDQQVAAAEELDSLGSNKLFGSLSEIAGAIPGVKGLTKGFDKAAEASKKIGADMLQKKLEDGKDASLTMGEALSAGFKGAIAGANELLKAFGPIAILGKVFQGMMKADESAGKIAKGLNVSTEEANKLSGQLLKASRTSSELGVTYDGQKHALMAINEELGTSSAINEKQLATYSKLENLAGMTQDQIKGIAQLQLATGKDAEKITGEFLAQAKASSQQKGVLLNEKKLLSDISNVSAATTLSLGKNPKAIANAVATAKALGMEMSKVEAIANSLLDFESSIEKELEAELLLGKNLNLEKARTAALNNDLATVASEIAEQAGSAAEFAELNRIEQQALADAVGMSREELAQTLFTQEQLKGLTEADATAAQDALDKRIEEVGLKQAQKELEEGGLENLMNQASEQEKMALASQQMNEAFMEMGKSLMPVLQTMTKIVTFAAENVKLIGTAIGLYGVINTLLLAQKLNAKGVTSEDKKQLLLGKSKLAQLAAQAVAFALANPITALIGLGVAAAVGTIAYNAMNKAGDINSPADGKTQISTKEGGLFELSPNDDIVAAPGASAALANASSGGGTPASNSKLEQLQAQTNALLRQVLSTQGTVSLDAEKMGTAISMNTYEISP